MAEINLERLGDTEIPLPDQEPTSEYSDSETGSDRDGSDECGDDDNFYDLDAPEAQKQLDVHETKATAGDIWDEAKRDEDLANILRRQDENDKTKARDTSQLPTDEKQDLRASTSEDDRNRKENHYRTKIRDCLWFEKESHTGDDYFIHHVVSSVRKESKEMALFLLKIALDLDQEQACLSSRKHHGDTLPFIHAVIKAESEMASIKNGNMKGFTHEVCRMLKDTSSVFAMVNKKHENCLHLVISHNISNADQIIVMASSTTRNNAFKQARQDTSDGGGNTPLHDALHFARVAKLVIPCSQTGNQAKDSPVQLDPNPREAVAQRSVVRRETGMLPGRTTTQVPGTTQVARSGHRVKRPPPKEDLCEKCLKRHAANKLLPDPKICSAVVKSLLAKCPEVLTQHNSAGQSPYAFHLATRSAAETALAQSSDMQLKPKPSGAAMKNSNDENHPDNVKGPASSRREGKEDNPKSADGESAASKPDEYHICQSNRHNLSSSDSLIDLLEEAVCNLPGGYQDTIQCFFQDMTKAKRGSAQSSPPRDQRNREFQLKKRVTSQTTKLYNFLNFEPRLALLRLSLQPDESYNKQASDAEQREKLATLDATNIKGIFTWLKDKGVRKIVKLVVKDNHYRYCSEQTVQHCLGLMEEVRFLDWNKPDLSVPTLMKAQRLVELSLYSSGLNAVLHHWSDHNGLVLLPKLKRILLYGKKGCETDRANKANVDAFKDRMKSVYEDTANGAKARSLFRNFHRTHLRASSGRAQEPTDTQKPKDAAEIVKALQEIYNMKGVKQWIRGKSIMEEKMKDEEKIKDVIPTWPDIQLIWIENGGEAGTRSKRDLVEQGFGQTITHPGFDLAQKFGTALKNNMGQNGRTNFPKIKVALIDDGVDPEYNGIGELLANSGFPHATLDGNMAPFYTSTNDHGSKMAWIISSICPFVEFYVAKIDNQTTNDIAHPTFDVDQAASAVEWALGEHVDILSMSWIFRASPEIGGAAEKLRVLIDQPSPSKPIMYCAARDTRGNDMAAQSYYPADCKLTHTIGAADIHCQPKPYVTLSTTDSLFPGENILEDSTEGGNSVATAVAAGVTALVLFCLKEEKLLGKLTMTHTRDTPKAIIDRLFKALQEEGTSSRTKYVDLANLFKFDARDDKITTKLLVDRLCSYVHGLAELLRPDPEGDRSMADSDEGIVMED